MSCVILQQINKIFLTRQLLIKIKSMTSLGIKELTLARSNFWNVHRNNSKLITADIGIDRKDNKPCITAYVSDISIDLPNDFDGLKVVKEVPERLILAARIKFNYEETNQDKGILGAQLDRDNQGEYLKVFVTDQEIASKIPNQYMGFRLIPTLESTHR